jgi:hypothetical protein
MRTFEKFILAIFFACLWLGIYRIWWYAIHEVPYGYDPGFFRYAIQTALEGLPNLSWISEPFLPYHEPLFPILSIILTFIGYTPDQIIGPFLWFLSVFTGFCIYFLGKQSFNRSVWLVWASIFFISIVQYQEYWWNYWRNIVGIIFLLVSLALSVKKSPLMILTLAGIFTIHRASALFLLIILIFLLLAESFRDKKIPWKKILYIFLGWMIALPLYARELSVLTDMVAPITTTFWLTTASGTFFTSREFFFLIFPYFLVLIPAIFQKVEKREFDIIFIGFLVWLFWSISRLFFYNRMFVFFDIFAILMAAYAIVYIIAKLPKLWGISLVAWFFLIQWCLYVTHAHEYLSRHSISREEFDIVENLDILLTDDSAILSTHRFYTPWLLGYSDRRTLAPWMLNDQIWDEETWNRFYFDSSDSGRCDMIQAYRTVAPKLYVFVWDQQPPLDLPWTCFRPILSNLSHPIVYEVIYR